MKIKVIFMPYCSFAMMGDSEMKLYILRFILNGMGMIRPIKIAISAMSKTNTWTEN